MLHDFVIADPDEAEAINAAEGAHSERWPSLDSKGLDNIELQTLWEILSEQPVDPSFMNDDDSILAQHSDEGPWVFLVPAELTVALASLDEHRLPEIAARWARTEEFVLDRLREEAALDYLARLVPFVKVAQERGKSLLLWMSL